VVRLAGDIDTATAPPIRERIERIQEGGHRNLRIDLGAVGFPDSSGVNLLVAAYHGATKLEGQLQVAGASSEILRLFALSGVNHSLSPSSPAAA
jgi:anti-sigma B factor antagonist